MLRRYLPAEKAGPQQIAEFGSDLKQGSESRCCVFHQGRTRFCQVLFEALFETFGDMGSVLVRQCRLSHSASKIFPRSTPDLECLNYARMGCEPKAGTA